MENNVFNCRKKNPGIKERQFALRANDKVPRQGINKQHKTKKIKGKEQENTVEGQEIVTIRRSEIETNQNTSNFGQNEK